MYRKNGAWGGATSRTVPGSIPGGVTWFFSDIFPSDRTMALGSTQPLVKMSTRNISSEQRWPVREAYNLATFMCRMSWKSGSLNFMELSRPHRACYGTALPLPFYVKKNTQVKLTIKLYICLFIVHSVYWISCCRMQAEYYRNCPHHTKGWANLL
jgi:hypothetical protein